MRELTDFLGIISWRRLCERLNKPLSFLEQKRAAHRSIAIMEGAPNDGTSADPAMTPIERQMQVIATSIQDLARETSRQNQELWQAIRKGPQNPHDNNQPPPRGGNGSNNQEADSHHVTRRRGDEIERTPPRSRHRAESAGSSAPPSQQKTAKTTRSSKQPERPDKSSKQPERQDRRDNSR